MDARCPLCTTLFQTERTGVQYCPNCGQQVNVAATTGPVSSGPGPNFSGEGAPPSSGGARGPTPWEERKTRGVVNAFVETVKQVVAGPVAFFYGARTTAPLTDAVLFAWVIAVISGILSVPFNFLRFRAISPDSLTDVFHKLNVDPEVQRKLTQAFAEGANISTGRMLTAVAVQLLLAPVFILIGAAIVHLFCLMFGAAKNGYGATARAVCYAYVPILFGFIPGINVITSVWSLVLLGIGIAGLQQTSAGKAVGVVLTPFLLCCCCTCLGVMAFVGAIAAAAGAAH